jgi:hypothetical protein
MFLSSNLIIRVPSAVRLRTNCAQLGTHHEAVHRKVKEVITLQNQNNTVVANQRLEEFELERHQLFAKLDELYEGA